MKSIVIRLILCLAVLLPVLSRAEGQSGALPEELQALVDQTGDFSGFSLLTADEDTQRGEPKELAVFVLAKGNCCVLFAAKELEDGWKLEGYTRKNLYPDREQNENLKLYKIDSERFQASWPGEDYCFYVGSATNYGRFYRAEFEADGDVCVAVRDPERTGLLFTCGGKAAYWELDENQQISFLNCNPMLFPKNIDSVEACNAVRRALRETHFGQDKCSTGFLKRNVKIYAMPDVDSEQIDRGDLFLQERFFYYGNAGEWHLIGWQEGVERMHLGYILLNGFPLTKRELSISRLHFDDVQLVTVRDTWMTNDPVLSQKRYLTIPSGTAVTGLSGWDASYIYGEVSIDGKVVRGFIPMLDLELAEDI